MESLIVKQIEGQWQPDEAIDWDVKVVRPRWMRRRTYAKLVSQFYHGEIATQQLCRRLIEQLDDGEASTFLRYQLKDELRHDAVYARYLARVGDILPADDVLAEALEGSLAWCGSPLGLIVAFHVVFEGGALNILERLGSAFPCPLFRQINAKILPDEARHVAFGVDYLRRHVADLDQDERVAMYRWVRERWSHAASDTQARHGIHLKWATRLPANWLASAWDRQDRLLQTIGLVSPTEAQALATR